MNACVSHDNKEGSSGNVDGDECIICTDNMGYNFMHLNIVDARVIGLSGNNYTKTCFTRRQIKREAPDSKYIS